MIPTQTRTHVSELFTALHTTMGPSRYILIAAVVSIAFLTTTRAVQAAPITIDVAGSVTSESSFSGELWPIGTFVSGSFTIDVGPGTIALADIDGASGSITWTLGSTPHTLVFSSGGVAGLSSTGMVVISLRGSDPLFPEMQAMLLVANVHENPIVATTSLYDALLASDMASVGLAATRPPSGFGDATLVRDPSFTVHAANVPEPGTLTLVGVGLFACLRRRHTA